MGNISERIRKLRRMLDLTQTEFADAIGSSQNTLANYEIGRRNPSNSVINNICKTFSVNEAWLRTGEGEMFIEMTRDERIAAFFEQIQMDDSDGFKRRFVSVLSQLDSDAWAVLADMAVKLVEEQERGKIGCGGADAPADGVGK